MTLVSPPHLPHVHCSGAQGMIFSTRFRCAGSPLRPGWFCRLRRCLSVVLLPSVDSGSGPRSISPWTSSPDTAGSRSSNCNWRSLSFSLRRPYFLIRSKRSSSSSFCTRISVVASTCWLRAICRFCSAIVCRNWAMIAAATGSSATGRDDLEAGFICLHYLRLCYVYVVDSPVFMRLFAISSSLQQWAFCTASASSLRSDRCRRSTAQTPRASTARGHLLMSANAIALMLSWRNVEDAYRLVQIERRNWARDCDGRQRFARFLVIPVDFQNASKAAHFIFRLLVAYRPVVATLTCPSWSLMVTRSTPACRSATAHEWRRRCGDIESGTDGAFLCAVWACWRRMW